MSGRMSKRARSLDSTRFAICDFHEQVGVVIKAVAKLRENGLAEPHHIALDSWLNTMNQALDDFHEAEQVSVALFNERAVRS